MPKRDRITIGLYSTQSGTSFNPAALREAGNIKRIRNGFAYAAKRAGKEPPEIVVSVLLIPEWDAGNSYSTRRYVKAEEDFVEGMRTTLDTEGLTDVTLENFYEKASEDERGYLEHLRARGSCADMIKNHAIISADNADRCHLQLDSNTQIHDFEGFYRDTFNAAEPKDHLVRLNASYYDIDYVSAHNKVVFTFPHSPFADTLREEHLRYCREHKDDHLSAEPKRAEEKSRKNSIYAKDFVVALSRLDLTKRATLPTEPPRTIFPAIMDRPEYTLTRSVVTAVNRSWGEDVKESTEILTLKRLPPFAVGDSLCDYASFCIAVKKHTEFLHAHEVATHPERSGTGGAASRFDDTEARETLLRISDPVVDKAIIVRFYDQAIREITRSSLSTGAQLKHMRFLASYFPDTRRGNKLTQELFGCSVEELIRDPKHYSSEYKVAELSGYRGVELRRLDERMDFLEARTPVAGRFRHGAREEIEALRLHREKLAGEGRSHRFTSFTDSEVREAYERDSCLATGAAPASAGTKLIARVEGSLLRRELEKRAIDVAAETRILNPYVSMSPIELVRIKRTMEKQSEGIGITREAMLAAKKALIEIRAAEKIQEEERKSHPGAI